MWKKWLGCLGIERTRVGFKDYKKVKKPHMTANQIQFIMMKYVRCRGRIRGSNWPVDW